MTDVDVLNSLFERKLFGEIANIEAAVRATQNIYDSSPGDPKGMGIYATRCFIDLDIAAMGPVSRYFAEVRTTLLLEGTPAAQDLVYNLDLLRDSTKSDLVKALDLCQSIIDVYGVCMVGTPGQKMIERFRQLDREMADQVNDFFRKLFDGTRGLRELKAPLFGSRPFLRN